MPWRPLAQFRNAGVPKLNNLRRAAAAGLRVPATCWAYAIDADAEPPADIGPPPWIIRSGSPTEDTRTTSNAGQLLSLFVRRREEFGECLRRVVEALPSSRFPPHPLWLSELTPQRLALAKLPPEERVWKRGAVFVQPLLAADEAGVAFFDGFYFERTQARGGNETLTSGQARGDVTRGHLERGDAWSDWLQRVHAVFGDDKRIDIEFARDEGGYVLLQSRPALFPVRRNPTLSLTNHKEMIGEFPSPWMSSALTEAGRDLSFIAADRHVLGWGESYAVELGERAWMNISFFYRWMDHFGLPRTTVAKNFGGRSDNAADARIIWRRFLPSVPTLLRFQFDCLWILPELPRLFRRIDRAIGSARSLPELHAATVVALRLALRGNSAINSLLAGALKVRQLLRIPGTARVVTRAMMDDYRRLAGLPPEKQAAGLDEWLKLYGHRGPLESDPVRPRFAELRDVLLRDLASTPPGAAPPETAGVGRLFRPLFWIDERREWFRDQLMHRWQGLRQLILEEARRLVAAGELNAPEDAFWLRGEELADGRDMRQAVAAAKERRRAVEGVELPLTVPQEEIQALLTRAELARAPTDDRRLFPGIGLTSAVVEGIVRKADDLMQLLTTGGFDPETILVVPTLEPSWAVVFPRVGGVVADVGGELSHASILLREARRPAVVNCTGIFKQVRDGERIRLDGVRGVVERLQ